MGADRLNGQHSGFNALVALCGELVRAEPGLPPEVARVQALTTLHERLAASRVRLAATAGARATEAAIVRLADTVVGIYAAHDYDTYRDAGG